MFSGIWVKVSAFLATIGAVLLAVIGYQRKAIKEKDHELKVKDKKIELVQEQDEFERQHDLEEQKANEEINKIVNIIDDNDKWNRL